MQQTPVPDDEQQRLQALRDLDLLDTMPEERFDRLTRMARQILDVPIATVSLIDAERQWFKSSQGLDICETGRDVAFCGHTVLGHDIFEVTDASKDPRFADNPLVTGDPHIRFYAGVPVFSVDGYGIGTLCIIDTRPRELNAGQRRALRDLAAVTASEINNVKQNKTDRELRAAQTMSAAISRAQMTFIANADRYSAFGKLLHDIVDLADSEYGFIGEVYYNSEGAPCLMAYATTHAAWSEDARAFYDAEVRRGLECSGHNTLFGAALRSGEPVIANTPGNGARLGNLLEGMSSIDNFLGIPIHHGGKLVAMLGLANRRGGYGQHMVDFFSPMLVTIGQLVVAAQVQYRFQQNQLELKRLSSVASQTTNGVIITDPEGRVQWINDGFTRITGYSLEEMRDRKPGSVLQGPETDPATVAQMRSALRRAEGFEVDVVNYTRLGEKYWVRIQCNPLHADDGTMEGYIAIESDITEQKKVEESLQSSETRLRGLFELSPIGIALNDYETGAFVDLNDALLKPTGYTREEFSELSYWDLTPAEYSSQEVRQLEDIEKTGRYGPFEKEYIRKDGTRYPVVLSGMAVYDSTGRKQVWSMVEDISERKRIERMKNEFISTVSHELRTPLTSITGALGLVVGGLTGEMPDRMREMLTIARNNSQRLGYMIDDLLDMEKLVAGQMSFDLVVQDLAPVLEKAVEENQAYADRFGVALRLFHGAEDARVRVDALRLQQVLANLLSNAAKFSPEGGEVTIQSEIRNGHVRVSVSDNGPGIPETFRDKIFQKFSQADASNTRKKGGSGLGLAITRELVDRMGGYIGFDSVPGEGAVFFFEFPLVTVEQQC